MIRLLAPLAVVALAAASAATAPAATLSLATGSTTGVSGSFFNVTTGASAVKITHVGFNIHANTPTGIHVYTRSGSFVGNTASNSGWSLASDHTVASATAGSLVNLDILDIILPAGTTTGFYFLTGQKLSDYATTGHMKGARYHRNTNGFDDGNPLTPLQAQYGDAYLTVDLGSRVTITSNSTNVTTFSNNTNVVAGEIFNGTLTYEIIPEPGTLLLAGSGVMLMLWRRRAAA